MWLQEHHYSEAELFCGYPHWLRGMSLTQLHHENFTCGQSLIILVYQDVLFYFPIFYNIIFSVTFSLHILFLFFYR